MLRLTSSLRSILPCDQEGTRCITPSAFDQIHAGKEEAKAIKVLKYKGTLVHVMEAGSDKKRLEEKAKRWTDKE